MSKRYDCWNVGPSVCYHPVNRSWTCLLEGVSENRSSKAAARRRLRCRWQLLYTLINNPSLLGSRKHFQTLQTGENLLNGTPDRSSVKGSKKEAEQPPAESSTDQAKDEWEPLRAPSSFQVQGLNCMTSIVWLLSDETMSLGPGIVININK